MPIHIDLDSFDVLSIQEMCEVCFMYGSIITYLQNITLCNNLRKQRRVIKYSATTFWCLNEIKNIESRRSVAASRRIVFEQFYATTKTTIKQKKVTIEKIEPLFNVFALTEDNFKKLTSEQLLFVFTAVVYKILNAMSDKILALSESHSNIYALRLVVLVKECITASIKMRRKLRTIFPADQPNDEKDIHTLFVEMTIV